MSGENKQMDIPFESSFVFAPRPLSNHPASFPDDDYIFDITKYIPAGCVRVQKSECIVSLAIWNLCHSWRAFAHPRDIYNIRDGPYLPNGLQEALFNLPALLPSRNLHFAGWIRMEFKIQDERLGQARIYILPDDIGRAVIDRHSTSMRRSVLSLLQQLDISTATWNGEWSTDVLVTHIDPSLDQQKENVDMTLFHLFNTLPSPNPDPQNAADPYARDAMYRILDSDIEGLKTTMYMYQRRSAALMLQREARPDKILDPRLRRIIDHKGTAWYCDTFAGTCFLEPRTYDTARGGICAETMGLGKTLICLALILATRDAPSRIPVEYSVGTIPVRKMTGSLMEMAAATLGRTGTPYKNELARIENDEGTNLTQCREALRKNPGYYYLPSPEPRRTTRSPNEAPPRKIWLSTATVVVVPANLIQQWRQEINKHTEGLKVLVMNDMKLALPSAVELAEFDIILFSSARFNRESKDGSDSQGRRRSSSSQICRCPFISNTHTRACTCFDADDSYSSPLRDIHFKRLITDEGHNFGNNSSRSKTLATTVIDFLQLDSRWIVSGTPTKGLYGVEIGVRSQRWNEVVELSVGDDTNSESPEEQQKLIHSQERRDLERLGNIATTYLKARPWANTTEDRDTASWAQLVMQPRHGTKSKGNITCLRATLEGMIIRHRPEDITADVILPPLHQNVVYLDGSMHDKLSLNLFSMMIVSNAITSERKDVDYFFHPRQRTALYDLVSNLRQASFFWSGYTASEVLTTIDIAKKFLDNGDVLVSVEDELLLREAIRIGETILSNTISKVVRITHEMPVYIANDCPEDVRKAWALDGDTRNPTLMGATMVHTAQKFVASQLWKEDPMEGMIGAGETAMKAVIAEEPSPVPRNSSRRKKTAQEPSSLLAGGVALGDGSGIKKRPPSGPTKADVLQSLLSPDDKTHVSKFTSEKAGTKQDADSTLLPLKSAMKKSSKKDIAGSLDPSSPLKSAVMVSTASAKLSYLIDGIVRHHLAEKILVFYEADNVAYYIAQALECLGIKHLIYAKSLSSSRRADYVVTFNRTENFRVLLMDVSQAAFGLDMSSASRVYFINPVLNPQIEAQAVKRAHRIGQKKPVFVETLVLKGSIEELILKRRNDMSIEEHNRCKNILDDRTMYDWIRNVRFLLVPYDGVPGPEQMAKLNTPQLIFGRSDGILGSVHDPDADLITFSNASDKKRKVTLGETHYPSALSDSQDGAADSKPGLLARDSQSNGIIGINNHYFRSFGILLPDQIVHLSDILTRQHDPDKQIEVEIAINDAIRLAYESKPRFSHGELDEYCENKLRGILGPRITTSYIQSAVKATFSGSNIKRSCLISGPRDKTDILPPHGSSPKGKLQIAASRKAEAQANELLQSQQWRIESKLSPQEVLQREQEQYQEKQVQEQLRNTNLDTDTSSPSKLNEEVNDDSEGQSENLHPEWPRSPFPNKKRKTVSFGGTVDSSKFENPPLAMNLKQSFFTAAQPLRSWERTGSSLSPSLGDVNEQGSFGSVAVTGSSSWGTGADMNGGGGGFRKLAPKSVNADMKNGEGSSASGAGSGQGS